MVVSPDLRDLQRETAEGSLADVYTSCLVHHTDYDELCWQLHPGGDVDPCPHGLLRHTPPSWFTLITSTGWYLTY